MFKRLLLALGLALVAAPASAQNVTCATRPTADSTNACASTAFTHNAITAVVPATASANTLYSGPTSGAAAAPAFRAMVPADLPSAVYGTQSANTIYSGPTTGAAAAPAFRALVPADIPTGIPAANSTYTQSGTGGVSQTVQANIALQPVTPQQFGAVGNGVADDTAAFNDALATVASGGRVRVPCGTYKVTTLVSVAVAAGKHIDFSGDGQDCAVIAVTGAINGPTFGFASQWSSVSTHDLTFTSDQTTGTNKCLVYTGSFTNANSAYAAQSSLYNVTFRGADAYSTNLQYCAVGFNNFSISNVNIIGLTFQGIATHAGIPIQIIGSGTGSTYAVQNNIVGLVANNCTTAVSYGDWTQGVQMTTSNITGCANGVTTVTSPAGSLSGLLVTNSQINAFTCDICINDAAFDNFQSLNNQLIVESGATGIKAQGTNFIMSGDEVNGVTGAATGISIGTTSGNGGAINGEHIANFTTGLAVAATSAAILTVNNVHWSINTADYSISASASGVQIHDTQSRVYSTVPACNSAIAHSRFMISDSTVTTYNSTISAGGGTNYIGMNCDGSRNYAD